MALAKRDGEVRSHCASRIGASIVASLALASAPAADRHDDFNVVAAAPGVYVHIGRQVALDAPGHDDIANIGFIVGAKCVAVIDTGGSVRTGRALRAAVRSRTSLPICYVINTHVHVDHVLGNLAFKEDKPSFVGHAALAEAMLRSRQYFVNEYGADFDTPPSVDQVLGPDRLVEHDLTLDLGDRPLQLRAWPKAHTDCDLTVYDERTATLWSGDLLFRGRLPALDGSIKGWLSAIDELTLLKASVVVPGHGGVTPDLAAALAPERHYLQAVLEGVRRELSEGKPMQDAIDHVAYDQKSRWLVWDGVHQRNVTRAYEELEWE
jgi:quinoprotein relay system zinc metallohydrolase 2